jgi:hypothetical protein
LAALRTNWSGHLHHRLSEKSEGLYLRIIRKTLSPIFG